ncbi:MAG: ester cyclase [SAR202 cluster bacterium]|nr:ester cyclase [SAR202 cluster bacterium]
MSESEKNKELLRQYTQEALIEGKLDAVAKYISPQYVHHAPPGPDIRGIEGMRSAVVAYRKAFSDLRIEIHDMVGEKDRVATRLTIHGTHSGEYAGIKATGKKIKLAVIAIDRFADCKVMEGWEFADVAGLRAQLTS